MKNKIFMLCLGFALLSGKSHAQWAVIDPTNLIQNTFTAVETGSTAANMIKNCAPVKAM